MQRAPTLTPRRATHRRPQAGMTMVLIMLVLFFILALSLVTLLNAGRGGDVGAEGKNALGLTRLRGERSVAQSLAESGIRMSLQWLSEQSSAPLNTAAFAPSAIASFYGGTTDASGWTVVTVAQGPSSTENAAIGQVGGTIKVRFYPYSSNTVSARKRFGIEVVGEYQGSRYSARVFVRQNSFARYAYFSDTAPAAWWVSGNTRFQGPVHVNGVDSSGTVVDSSARINILWKADSSPSSGDWIFSYPGDDYFTTAMAYSQLNWTYTDGSSASFYDPNWWAPYWQHITAAAKPPITNAPIIRMPTATTDQKSVALGTLSEPALGTVGVFVPNSSGACSAGIYIAGDVSDMNLTVSSHSGHEDQRLEVVQPTASGEQQSLIELCPQAPHTQVQISTRDHSTDPWNLQRTDSYSGATNGVLYVQGDIGGQASPYRGGLSGTIANGTALSIVTGATNTLNINGGLVYSNLITNVSNPNNLGSSAGAATSLSGVLGLVAGTFRVPESDDSGSALTALTIHAVCMAYDTFVVVNPTSRPAGVINLLGGSIVKRNSQLGVTTVGGSVLNGFIINRIYDVRIGNNPPPAYPSTDRSYQILSYQKVNTTLN